MATPDSTTKTCISGDNCAHPLGPELPATTDYFHKRSDAKDGLRNLCRACCSRRKRAWYAENAEHAREYSRQWARDNYHRVLANRREWNRRNPQKKAAYNHRWKQSHRAIYLAGRRRRYQARAEANRAYTQQWRKRHPELVRIQWKARQARERSAEGNHTPSDIRQLHVEQDDRCGYCGIRLFNEYHVDHIHPVSRGGSNYPDNLLLTCEYCNLSKKDKTVLEWEAIRGW